MGIIIPLAPITGSSPSRPTKRPSRKIKVGWLNLNNSFSGQTYFPYSVGSLQAYAQKFAAFPDSIEFKSPIFQIPENVEEVAEELSEVDILGASTYGWNIEKSLGIARAIKKRNPSVITIFGGPQIPDSKKQFQRIKKSDPRPDELQRRRLGWTEEFHRRNPEVDIACHGEGERIFTRIIDQMMIDGLRNRGQIPSISYLDRDGNFHHNPKLERMNDQELAEAPSPYTEGVFDHLFDLYKAMIWIAILETNRGCPYQCTYCEWGGAIEDKVFRFSMRRLYSEAMWFGQKNVRTVFCADDNYGILERDVKISRYLARARRKYDFPKGVSVQNAKNPKEHTIKALLVLQKAGLNRATVMSQQSTNSETLRLVRRQNMEIHKYKEMQQMAAREGIHVHTDLIFPMPAETYDSIVDGTDLLISNGQHSRIQYGIISNWPNTEMNSPDYVDEHGIETVRVRLVNTHGKKTVSRDGIDEWQYLAIATKSMPRSDWVKTRVFTWIVDALYFNKILQIPAIVLNQEYGVEYRKVFELFSSGRFRKYGDYPVLTEALEFFTETAIALQEGRQEEFVHSKEWLDIYWPPAEYILIKLVKEGRLDDFYRETHDTLRKYLADIGIEVPEQLLADCITLNRSLLKIPFQTEDLWLNLSYNVWDIFKSVLRGNEVKLEQGQYSYLIDRTKETWDQWDKWYQEVVWYCNRGGAYLYGNKNPHEEIAGHH